LIEASGIDDRPPSRATAKLSAAPASDKS
jgi:hypothetical protein